MQSDATRAEGVAIRHAHTILLVNDLEVSKAFYVLSLGQQVRRAEGPFIEFEGGFAIHDAANLLAKVYKAPEMPRTEHATVAGVDVYFECADLEAAYLTVTQSPVDVIHPIERQAWGQRVFRLHDPDGNIVEVGEPMSPV